MAAKQPLKITDATLRDGHQSLLATRMKTEDMIILAEKMDKVGFYSMEVWGGATFDVCLRFLNEDPWERLRILKKLMPRTPLQMLLRGQNLVGYRPYADDVVESFIQHAAECGIDIFRIFDALNDERNLESSLNAVKKCGKHAQLTLCYSLIRNKLGGRVYNLDYYLKKAAIFEKMGADSLCIKDMAGLLAPDDSYKLIKALKKVSSLPIQLHCHCTSGMAPMAYLKAVEAGVDVLDTALSPLALRSSLPAIEPIVASLKKTPKDTGLSLIRLFNLGKTLESLLPKYQEFLNTAGIATIDSQVLKHQLPGGMISNLAAQLKEIDKLDELGKVLKEIPRVRKELGYPPLVTPSSQIVGAQAVFNVIAGRYKLISNELRNYVYGLYGRPPAPIDPQIQKLVLERYQKGNKPITCRPADLLEPELNNIRKKTAGIAQDIGDILSVALFKKAGMKFLRNKKEE